MDFDPNHHHVYNPDYRSHDSPHNPQELHAYNDDNPHSPLTRSPSMLQRLKSINLHNYFPTEAISSRFSPHEDTIMNVANEPEKRHLEFPPAAAAEEEDEVEESDGGGEIERWGRKVHVVFVPFHL